MSKLRQVEEDGVILDYCGRLSYEEIGHLLNKVMECLNRMHFGIVARKKVYATMVEGLENVYKHQDVVEENCDYLPKVKIEIDGGSISIVISNSIRQDKKEVLIKRLEKVNNLDKNELKDFYREVILHGKVSDKGGAGLGIINIAKVSENKLDYFFYEINSEYLYFTLKVRIPHGNPNFV